MNAVVGDIAGNAARILDFARRANDLGADVMLTPELALCGYPPEDLLLREDFYAACAAELELLAGKLPELPVIVGHPLDEGGRRFNAATLIEGGKTVATYRKQRLPNAESLIFDDAGHYVLEDRAAIIVPRVRDFLERHPI